MKIGIMGGTFNPIHEGHIALAKSAKDALSLDEVWFIPTGTSYSKATKPVLPGKERLKMVELALEEVASLELNGQVKRESQNRESQNRELQSREQQSRESQNRELQSREQQSRESLNQESLNRGMQDDGDYDSSFRCLDIEIARGGYTYSYQTLEELKERFPQHTFFFIVGADCLFTIENWKEPERLLGSCTLAAALRGNVVLGDMEKKKAELETRFQAKIVLFSFAPMDISSTIVRSRISDGESIKGMVPESVRKYIEEKGFYREKDTHCK